MDSPPVVLSFDVEEHYRIEAAHGLAVPPAVVAEHARRMERTTRLLLERLDRAGARATFFVLGEIALSHPGLVRAIAAGGHELASHSHRHRQVHRLSRAEFREDLLASKRALEAVGAAGRVEVVGYRAPTFSLTAETHWAVDELAAAGFRYDSSVFPVRHDRYGSPAAPRGPFRIAGVARELLELPPATLRLGGMNVPTAGGGYFRLFPLWVLHAGVDQLARAGLPAMLYFHPWEFDPGHPRLPLGRKAAARTYVGVGRTLGRLDRLLDRYAGRFRTAREVSGMVRAGELPTFTLATERVGPAAATPPASPAPPPSRRGLPAPGPRSAAGSSPRAGG